MTPNTRQHADDVLVQALTAGKRVAEAAALAGVSTRTVFRRLQDHDFKERLTEVRTAAMTSAAGRLSDHLVRACEVLTDLVWVDDPHLRLKAAKAAIELTLKVQAHQDAQANAPANWGPLVVIGEEYPSPKDDDGEENRGPDDPAPGPVTRGPGPGQPPGGASPGSPPAGPVPSREGFGAGNRVSPPPAGPAAENTAGGLPKSDKCCQAPGGRTVGAASGRPRFAVPKSDGKMPPRRSGRHPEQPLSCHTEYERSSGCVRGARALASRSRSRDNPILRVTSASDRVGQRPTPAEPGRGSAPDKQTRTNGFASPINSHGPGAGRTSAPSVGAETSSVCRHRR